LTELNGAELLHGKLRVKVEEIADKQDYKLVAWKEPRRAPAKRPYKPVVSEEEAKLIADELIAAIMRHPNPGKPNRDVIEYFCLVYPRRPARCCGHSSDCR
jgi:hypothetical protein